MLDLGTTFLQSVERRPDALAVVDGQTRFTYAQWLTRIRAVAGGLAQLGLKRNDHLVVAMQNRWEMATRSEETRLNSSHIPLSRMPSSA